MSALELARLRASGGCTVPARRDGGAGRRRNRAVVAAGRDRGRARPPPGGAGTTDLEIVPATLRIPRSWPWACASASHGWTGTTTPIPVARSRWTTSPRGARFGITVAAGRHVIGAVRNVLVQARLLSTSDGEWFKLGPAVAGWDDADLDAFRRNHDVLPQPLEAST